MVGQRGLGGAEVASSPWPDGGLRVDAGVLTPSWPPAAAWSARPGAHSAESEVTCWQSCDRSPSHPGCEVRLSSLLGRRSLLTCCLWTKPRVPMGSCLRSRLQAGPQGCTSLRQAGRPGGGTGRCSSRLGGWGGSGAALMPQPSPARSGGLWSGAGTADGELGGLLTQQDPVLGRARDLASKPSSALANGAA